MSKLLSQTEIDELFPQIEPVAPGADDKKEAIGGLSQKEIDELFPQVEPTAPSTQATGAGGLSQEEIDALFPQAQTQASEVKSLDLMDIPDKDFQIVLREIELDTLILALQGDDKDLHEKVIRNVTGRTTKRIEEGSGELNDVEANELDTAKQKILDLATQLFNAGKISFDLEG